MIFDLPPIFGLTPLVVYIILAFNPKIHAFVNVAICVVIGGIMTKTNLLEFGKVINSSLGSFLGLVGFIIMLGSGLGVILKETGVAENMVHIMMRKIGVNTMDRAILASMITSLTMVFMLSTLTGGNAVIAPIIIPLVASIGMTPSTLSIILQAAGVTGLFISPFSPPMVTIMQITGLSYLQILLYASLPVCIAMWVITFFYARRVQKTTAGVYAYPEGTAIEKSDYKPSKETTRATLLFSVTMLVVMAYGIIFKVGVTHAITVMFFAAVATGVGAKLKASQIFEYVMKGCGQYVWLFFLFIMIDPFLAFIEKSGAFVALLEISRPLIDATGKFGLSIISALLGIFAVQGAAVAQALMLDSIFRPMVDLLGMSMKTWALVALIGSQMTSFAYPGLDMIAAMGTARSSDLKPMMKNGWMIIGATMLICVFSTLFFA